MGETLAVKASLLLSGIQQSPTLSADLQSAIAGALDIEASSVTILDISVVQTRRHILQTSSLNVTFAVQVSSQSAAQALSTGISGDGFLKQLSTNLPGAKATLLTAPLLVLVHKDALAPPSAGDTSSNLVLGLIVGGVTLGGTATVVGLVWAWRRKKRNSTTKTTPNRVGARHTIKTRLKL
jgi:hypothetical protein